MRLWSSLPRLHELAARLRRPRLATLEALAEVMAAQSAFVAQKCTVDYCQARSGFNWPHLQKEAAFREALDRARWEAYPVVLSDVGIMFEGLLRPAVPEHIILTHWLISIYAGCLERYGPPRHRSPGATWADDIDHFRRRLAQAQLAPPRPVHEVGGESGAALHRLMPMHPSLTSLDAEMIGNNVKMRLCRVYEDLERDLDRLAIAEQLAHPH
jgi:hypothetical protein